MSRKRPPAAVLETGLPSPRWETRYAAFFVCFNRQRYFEAHEVLEPLWLERRHQAVGPFYKGLIQAAGGLVHLQKHRLNPAARLFRLALANVRPFAPRFDALDVREVTRLLEAYLRTLDASNFTVNPYNPQSPPHLQLRSA